MHEDHGRSSFGDGLAKDFTWMYERRVQYATRYGHVAFQSVLRVEHRDVELFHRQILHPRRKHRKNVPRRPEWCAVFALLGGGSSTQLERRVNRDCARRAEASELGQRGDWLTCDSSQRSIGPGKYFVCEPKR
jgi:hypothetical protein